MPEIAKNNFVNVEVTQDGPKIIANKEALREDFTEESIEAIQLDIDKLNASLRKELDESSAGLGWVRKLFLADNADRRTPEETAEKKIRAWVKDLDKVIAKYVEPEEGADDSITKFVNDKIGFLDNHQAAFRNDGNNKMANLDDALRS